MMNTRGKGIASTSVAILILAIALLSCQGTQRPSTAEAPEAAQPPAPARAEAESAIAGLIDSGRQVFRFETFGDEAFWGGALRLHEAIAGAAGGGTGPGLSPNTALSVGLKVDVEAIPADLAESIRSGGVDLDDPASTLALLYIDAVVGVKGFFDSSNRLTGVGITCALCHSTVDDSFSPGIGSRLDGWPNRDLNVGAIVALAPNLQPVADLLGVNVAAVRTVLESWGPGRYDAELNQDGKAFRRRTSRHDG